MANPAPALTSDENTALAGASTRKTYLKPFPATTIATARVNGSLAYPIPDIPTDGESAGWTDIKKGMTVLIGTAAGLQDVARFRVREDVTGTGSIAVGEFGTNDTGDVAFLTPTAIADNQFITVINTRDIFAVFPRIDYGGGIIASIYEDFEMANTIANLQPSPVVRIKTNNSRGGHYGVKVADGATVAITAVATVEHWPSSSSVLSYQWAYPAGFTGVSGATSATLTATAPVGNHEISCTVQPDYGAAFKAVRYIVVCDDTTNVAIPIASVDGDSRNRTARRVSLGLNNTAVTGIPDGSGVIMFDMCTWNGSDVPTATTTMVGWLSQIGFSSGGGLRQAGPEIIGIGEVLGMLTNSSQLFEVANVPTVWQQMGYNLATFNWCIWWLLTYRASNVLTLFNFHPYSVSASVGRLPAFEIGSGSILSQVNGLAQRYRRGNVGSNSGGEIFVTVPASMIETASRSGLTTRALITATKITNISWRRDIRPRVRQIEGQAFTWDGAATLPTPLKAVVPERPGQGSSDDTLGEQIVASQTELNAITGLYYNYVNNPIQSVSFTIPKNYDVLEPAEGTLVNVTVPAANSPTGVEWIFDATVASVNKRYLEGGATEMDVTVEPLTSGAAGKTVPVPPPGENMAPDVPPFDEIFPIEPFPDWGPELTIDPGAPVQLDPLPGASPEYPQMFGATSDSHVWKVANSVFVDISPTSGQRTELGTGLQLVTDPWRYQRAFLIGTSGIAYTDDINLSGTVIWNTFARFGVADEWSEHADFIDSDNGWTTTIDAAYIPDNLSNYSAGVGFIEQTSTGAAFPTLRFCENSIETTFTETPLTSITCHYTNLALGNNSGDPGAVNPEGFIYIDSVEVLHVTNLSAGSGSFTWTGNVTGSSIRMFIDIAERPGPTDCTGTATIVASTTTGNGTNPFSGAPPFALDNETIIGSFQGYANKKYAFCWLSKRTVSAVDYVYFNRTMDDFASYQSVQVATWVADMNYSIAISPFNWRFVWCTAGDPGGSDAFVYRSSDGGGSFVVTSVGLYTRGGQLHWNYSTSTPNSANTSNINILIVRGLNGSNNYLIRRGLTGSDITIANGSGKYGLQPASLYQLARDGDFVRVGLQDNAVRLSTDFAATFSAGTGVTGGSSAVLRGLSGWPTDDAFGLLFGYRILAYTVDTFGSYTSLWATYDTFRSGTYSSEGETIVTAMLDWSQHYIRPVASEA